MSIMTNLNLQGTDIVVGSKAKGPERVFMRAENKNTCATVIYLKSNKYYYESAGTNEVKAADMMDLFKKGLIVMDASGNAKIPVACAANGTLSFATTV